MMCFYPGEFDGRIITQVKIAVNIIRVKYLMTSGFLFSSHKNYAQT